MLLRSVEAIIDFNIVIIVHIIIVNIIINVTIFTRHELTAAAIAVNSVGSIKILQQTSQELTISECAAKIGECDESKGRPVCGTDDQTYPSRCHLIRAQCSGHQVSIKYRGPCKACTEAREYALKHRGKKPPKFIPRCKRDGTYSLIQCLANTGCWCSDISGKPIENTSVRTGKPKCRAFSKKANKRRSPSRGLGGGSSGSGGRGGAGGGGGGGQSINAGSNRGSNNGRRTCTDDDRLTFNHNLLKIFQTEYSRMLQQKQLHHHYHHQQQQQQKQQQQQQRWQHHQQQQYQEQHILNNNVSMDKVSLDALAMPHDNKIIIDWKFANLDANKNEMLDKIEYRELKKLVKRAVKPRRCGRAFGKFCDMDKDERLSHYEWNNCLSKDAFNRFDYKEAVDNRNNNSNNNTHNNDNNNNNNNNNGKNNGKSHNNNGAVTAANSLAKNVDDHTTEDDLDDLEYEAIDYDDETDYDDGENLDTEQLTLINMLRSPTKFPSIHFLVPNGPNSSRQETETETESNCLTDQAAALEDQNHSNGFMYVPECTADGRYQRVQCYRSTPYCWCVNEDTGKNILGSSVKDRRPQCDNFYTTMRPMKGCPEPRKATFLKELKEYLKSHIISKAYRSGNNNNNKWKNEDERIASLSFAVLDKNQNKFWERKEWKIFRELVANTKTLRKCGKKMPRYCDANSDKKITLNEWISCLQVQNSDILNIQKTHITTTIMTTNHSGSMSSKTLKLTGSNPLEQYLKD